MNGTYRFYDNVLYKEQFICECNQDELMGDPIIGDFIALPINADNDDQDIYVIKQRVVYDNHIDFFCKLYNWED